MPKEFVIEYLQKERDNLQERVNKLEWQIGQLEGKFILDRLYEKEGIKTKPLQALGEIKNSLSSKRKECQQEIDSLKEQIEAIDKVFSDDDALDDLIRQAK